MPKSVDGSGQMTTPEEVQLGDEEQNRGEEGTNPEPEPADDHPLLKEEGVERIRIPPALLLVYLSVFIDAFGGLMAIPVLPQIVIKATEQGENFGLDLGMAYGLLSACYQFFSVPSLIITTSLADTYGRRPFFMLGFLGSAVGFFIMAFHDNINPMLLSPLIGRSMGGVFSASPPLAHGYISDIVGTKSKESSVYRSYLGSIFMFALIFAPGFGGGLSELGLSVPFFVSTGLAVMGFLLSFVYLKESLPSPKPICGKASEDSSKKGKSAAAKDDNRVRRESEIAREEMHHIELRIIAVLFVMGALLNFGFRISIMMWPLWLNRKFGWGAATYGFATSAMGCFGIFFNIKFYPKALAKFGKHGCCVLGSTISGLGFMIVWASRKSGGDEDPYASGVVLKGPIVYMLGMIVVSLGNSMTQSSLSSLIARYASKNQQSGIQGKYRALQAVTGFAAPLVGGAIYDSSAWNHLPAISAAVFFAFAILGRIVVKLNHDLHRTNPSEHDSYPSHSWCEIIPGVQNPMLTLHHNAHNFWHHSTHHSAMGGGIGH
jgi:MFS family permease